MNFLWQQKMKEMGYYVNISCPQCAQKLLVSSGDTLMCATPFCELEMPMPEDLRMARAGAEMLPGFERRLKK